LNEIEHFSKVSAVLGGQKPNPDKPEIPNHKYQISNKSQCPKFKIPNADTVLKKERSNLEKSK